MPPFSTSMIMGERVMCNCLPLPLPNPEVSLSKSLHGEDFTHLFGTDHFPFLCRSPPWIFSTHAPKIMGFTMFWSIFVGVFFSVFGTFFQRIQESWTLFQWHQGDKAPHMIVALTFLPLIGTEDPVSILSFRKPRVKQKELG